MVAEFGTVPSAFNVVVQGPAGGRGPGAVRAVEQGVGDRAGGGGPARPVTAAVS